MSAEDQLPPTATRKKPPRLTLNDDGQGDRYAHAVGSGAGAGAAAPAFAVKAMGSAAAAPMSKPPEVIPPIGSSLNAPASANTPWSPIKSHGSVLRGEPTAVMTFLSTLNAAEAQAEPRSMGAVLDASATKPPNALVNHSASFHWPRNHVADKLKKRGRVESANYDEQPSSRASSRSNAITMLQSGIGTGSRVPAAKSGLANSCGRNKRGLPRSHSTPNLFGQVRYCLRE